MCLLDSPQDTKLEESFSITQNTTSVETSLARPTQGNFNRNKKFHKHKKICWLCRRGILLIDYKDTETLNNYLRRYNKILIHKISGNCLKHQHQLAQAIKRARYIGLLPFVPE